MFDTLRSLFRGKEKSVVVQSNGTVDDLRRHFFCKKDDAPLDIIFMDSPGHTFIIRKAECPQCHGRVFSKAKMAANKVFDWTCSECNKKCETLLYLHGKAYCDPCMKGKKDGKSDTNKT